MQGMDPERGCQLQVHTRPPLFCSLCHCIYSLDFMWAKKPVLQLLQPLPAVKQICPDPDSLAAVQYAQRMVVQLSRALHQHHSDKVSLPLDSEVFDKRRVLSV